MFIVETDLIKEIRLQNYLKFHTKSIKWARVFKQISFEGTFSVPFPFRWYKNWNHVIFRSECISNETVTTAQVSISDHYLFDINVPYYFLI